MPSQAQPRKVELRRRLRRALASLTPTARQADSARLCTALQQSPVWTQAGRVLLYAPLPDEVDISPLWPVALEHDKVLCLPRFDPQQGNYQVAAVAHPERQLVSGHFGILEPDSVCPEVKLNRLDLAVVPGLGFDANGRRLGRGGGFYDRLLAGMKSVKCGIGFDLQWVHSIPQEPCDVVLDCILTPRRGFVWSPARF